VLRELRSLKLKLGIVIVAAILVTAATTVAAVAAGLPTTLGAVAGIVLALACAQLLAHGMIAPLREMAAVAGALAAGGQVREVEVTTADEVGELALAFNRMTAQIADTDRLRRDVIANVSHELRTPLGALQAALENVVEGVTEPDPQTLATMLAQTKRLGRLVAQLLDLSRLEAGEQRFDIRPFGVRDVLESAAREARLHAPPDVVFAIDALPDLRAAGDPERIHQVVSNLVENAVRYSPRPGCVQLRAAGNGAMVSFVVEDDGPGIPAQDVERIFERFRRGDRAPHGGSGGAGLGLAIARWIVELHGGEIRAERRDPNGTRFVVTLPQAA
jgi:signal transduction histidine kinase